MPAFLTIAHLTLYDARRRKILSAAAACGALFLAVFWTVSFLAARDLVQNLPRGMKDAIKASQLFRRAARTFVGTTIAVSGDDQGFSNLAELCARMESIVGGEEPFMLAKP